MTDGTENGRIRHPDIFNTEEAAQYLGLKSERSLESLREKWGLRPLPLGRGLYHRDDLDAVVERARGGQANHGKAGRPGKGAELKLNHQ